MFSLIASGPHAVDPLLLILAALALDALLGDSPLVFRILPHPVKIVGSLAGFLEKKLNRPRRHAMDRAFRGFVLLMLMAGLALAAGIGVEKVKQSFAYGWVLELALAWMLIAQRSLFEHVLAVGRALKAKGLAGGREAVSHIVGRDVKQLDEHGVARAAVESCAENFGDGVVAPVFWYVLLGVPGLLLYKTVNTLDSMIGHKTERYRAFGVTSARLDDLMNLIPARLSGLLFVLAAFFVPTANPFKSFWVMVRDARKHRSPNAGWPEGAMAGALGLSLSGPRHYPEGPSNEPWIGRELRARATQQDIRRSLYMLAVGCFLNAVLVGGLWLLLKGGQLSLTFPWPL
ncbi:MAG: cobalamin biosynthesis protein CobD [Alphaproteobacteria bacterium]|nr:cobalamin biosynthesis protein CobD [Alphaproteobacteria bacterium]